MVSTPQGFEMKTEAEAEAETETETETEAEAETEEAETETETETEGRRNGAEPEKNFPSVDAGPGRVRGSAAAAAAAAGNTALGAAQRCKQRRRY